MNDSIHYGGHISVPARDQLGVSFEKSCFPLPSCRAPCGTLSPDTVTFVYFPYQTASLLLTLAYRIVQLVRGRL